MKKVHTAIVIIAILLAYTGKLVAQSSAGLPVVLSSFGVQLTTDEKVAITWSTKQQISTDFFNVEKSNDGASWYCIAVVNSSGTTTLPVTYNVIDKFPLKGSNFYRVLYKNINGEGGYTNIQNAHINRSCSAAIYPNPAASMIHVLLGEVPVTDWTMLLMDNTGRVVAQKKYNKKTITIDIPVDKYPNGSYTLEITDGHSRQRNKLLINHN